MSMPSNFRFLLLAAPALILGGCVTGEFASSYGGTYAPVAYDDKKPGDVGYRDAYMIGASGDYDWIDRADSFARAIGQAEPDFTFRADDHPVWAWEAADGELLLIEPKGDDVLQFYFAPDGQLYLTRSATSSYGYDRGTTTVSYDVDGRLATPSRRWDGDEATDLFLRGRELLDAYRQYRRFGRGGYAANRVYGYDGGYSAWGSTILIAPYAPRIDGGWSRGWQPRWRNRPDWNDARRPHPPRDRDRWQRRNRDGGGFVNPGGTRPNGNAGPDGGWVGRGQGAGRGTQVNGDGRDGEVRTPPPGAPAFTRDRDDRRSRDGSRDMRGGDSWSGPVTGGGRALPDQPAQPPRPRGPRPPVGNAPQDGGMMPPVDAGTQPMPPARPPRDRGGFDSPVVDRPVVDRPVARIPLPASDAPSRYSPPPVESAPPPRYDPPSYSPPPQPAPPPPPPSYSPPARDDGPVAAPTATRGSDDNNGLRPD